VKSEIDTLSEYYRAELLYLRTAGEDFAHRYPKIAKRLDLLHDESSDPHVERLIESFAFLTGKLQKQIDDQYPEMGHALLNVLYNPLMLPIPSVTMINFEIDLSRAAKNAGMVVPRHTLLQANSHSGMVCTFRTAQDLTLWPITVKFASLVEKEALPSAYAEYSKYVKLELHCHADDIAPPKLRFYITADPLLRGKIFAGIFSANQPVIMEQNNAITKLWEISPIGLEDEEALFEYPANAYKGFRYLQEYFAFPDKFYGFDVEINQQLSEFFTLYIPIRTNVPLDISSPHFSLTTVPAVNLFPKISEPLRLDYKQVEYRLVPDYRRYDCHEIYSITKMVAVDEETNDEIEVPEFYSCHHFSGNEKMNISWIERRKESSQSSIVGDESFVSFVDENFNPQQPAGKIFYAYTLCTNRHVAEDIPAHGMFQTELSLPVRKIYCLNRPTSQKNAVKTGAILWKLISILSLNSLSFSENGIEKLKEILRLFSNVTGSILDYEIDAITHISSKMCMKRVSDQAWYGFVHGSDVTINFDEKLYNRGLPLSLVISKFLATHATVNTFVDVHIKSEEGILKTWATHFGTIPYL